LVLGLFSGYLKAIAPVWKETLRFVPGGIASLSALILLLLFSAIAPAKTHRRTFWIVLASAATVFALWKGISYPALLAKGTVEVPEGHRLQSVMRVKGTLLTPDAAAYVRLPQAHDSDDKTLINALGGIDKVWTEASIREEWQRLTRQYVLCVVSAILAIAFLFETLRSASPSADGSAANPLAPPSPVLPPSKKKKQARSLKGD
jgi:hypothetical protein